MANKIMSADEWQKNYQNFKAELISIERIAKEYNCSETSIKRKFAKMRRNSGKSGCYKCGHVNPDIAKFCNQCGTYLKTKTELALDNIAWCMKMEKHLPESEAKQMHKILLELNAYITGGKQDA